MYERFEAAYSTEDLKTSLLCACTLDGGFTGMRVPILYDLGLVMGTEPVPPYLFEKA
jgi:hypothetical protein